MLDVERVANNTGDLCSIRNDTEHFIGLSLGVFLVFDWGVFELDLLDREQMERLGDRHGGDLGTDLLGEEDSLLDGFGGEIRPVCRDQDVLEQRVLLRSLPSLRLPLDGGRVWSSARKDRLTVRSASP